MTISKGILMEMKENKTVSMNAEDSFDNINVKVVSEQKEIYIKKFCRGFIS